MIEELAMKSSKLDRCQFEGQETPLNPAEFLITDAEEQLNAIVR